MIKIIGIDTERNKLIVFELTGKQDILWSITTDYIFLGTQKGTTKIDYAPTYRENLNIWKRINI